MSYNPIPPLVWGYQPVSSPILHTPILAEFENAALTAGGISTEEIPEDIWLKFSAPSTMYQAVQQLLPAPSWFNLPSNRILKIKLFPTEHSNGYSVGAYKVEFFRAGNRLPFSTQYWSVPIAPSIKTREILRGPENLSDKILDPVYEILDISYKNGSFHVENNSIIWDSNPPAVGSRYTIQFQPAITLDQLVDLYRSPTPQQRPNY